MSNPPYEPDLPDWFDPDGTFDQADDVPDLEDELFHFGITSWSQIITPAPPWSYPLDEQRPGRYLTPGDAIRRGLDSGIVGFAKLWYDPTTETWGWLVTYIDPV